MMKLILSTALLVEMNFVQAQKISAKNLENVLFYRSFSYRGTCVPQGSVTVSVIFYRGTGHGPRVKTSKHSRMALQ